MVRIGATETYDPCFDMSWSENLYEANIIITKNISNQIISKLLENKEKCILHATITGWGGTMLEPNVPTVPNNVSQLLTLIDSGFPAKQIVIRIDPIIPNEYGLRILDRLLEYLKNKLPSEINRVRVSVIDMYSHVIDRWRNMLSATKDEYKYRYEIPSTNFTCSQIQFEKIARILESYSDRFNFESCAEPKFNSITNVVEKVGCVSNKDLDILGVSIELEGPSRQRKTCLCPGNKYQLIKRKPGRCPHNCVYCYWKD